MILPGQALDGYRLIRPIGRGGFGEVWLCRLEATGEFRALKFLPASDAVQLERELAALIRYRTLASELQCPHLLSIEHVNRTEDGLYYLMPLADGATGEEINDPAWQPKTLAALIAKRRTAPVWFSVEEIREITLPLVRAVQKLNDAGVVHRDIKPENILFIGGCPCLGDVSLLTPDAAEITRRGTPGYAAPSWYLESGGNPDMWGVSTTLYSLLTGNAPDKLGRAAFLWPPQGEPSVDQEAWNQFHRIILRTTHEKASERYLRFDALADTLFAGCPSASGPSKVRRLWPILPAAAVLVAVDIWYSHYSVLNFKQGSASSNRAQGSTPLASPSIDAVTPGTPLDTEGRNKFGLTKKETADYQALAMMSAMYVRDRDFKKALNSLDTLLSTYEIARKNATYHALRAECLLELGRYQESMDAVNHSLMISLDPAAYGVRIKLWEKLGDFAGAETDATTVIKEFKPYSPHFFQRAEIRILRKNFAGAEDDLKAAEKIDNEPDRAQYVATMRASLATKYPEFAAFLYPVGNDAIQSAGSGADSKPTSN